MVICVTCGNIKRRGRERVNPLLTTADFTCFSAISDFEIL